MVLREKRSHPETYLSAHGKAVTKTLKRFLFILYGEIAQLVRA